MAYLWLVLPVAWAQVDGPFELPQRFGAFRFSQLAVGDCSLPLPGSKARLTKSYRVGRMIAQVSDRVRAEGKDAGGAPWVIEVAIKHGGCWLWRADLDRNGQEDLIVLTSEATSSGESLLTFVMLDSQGT